MACKKTYCINCGKNGHLVKDCSEPVFSYGIICMKLDNKLNISPQIIEKFLVNKIVDIEEYNFTNLTNLSKIDYYKDKIINLYENLCKKSLLRFDYEFNMRAWGSPTIKKTLDHFLTFDYPSLNNERKNYLPLFDDIMNIGRQYSL